MPQATASRLPEWQPAIRVARAQDGEAIAAIYAHHVLHGTATFDTVPRSTADTVARIEECLARLAVPGGRA
jgi:L-amino acid N-acyltransferase YncA